MSPFDLAWSVLKSDPYSQAWDRSYGSQRDPLAHPDTPPNFNLADGVEDGYDPSLEIRNRGTIDPRVMSMRDRATRYTRSSPVIGSFGTEVSGRDTPAREGFGTSFGEPSDYMNMHDRTGFTALAPLFGISRVDRAEATTQTPPTRSPQHIIDSFMADGSPLTPENEAELARRLRMVQQ